MDISPIDDLRREREDRQAPKTHTPGPWQSIEPGIGTVANPHCLICNPLLCVDIAHVYRCSAADLRLVLAAPQLLAACKAAKSQVPTYSHEGNLSEVYRQIVSAIAAATGEKP